MPPGLWDIGSEVWHVAGLLLFKDRSEACGIIDVDHTYEQCKVRLTSRELLNRKKKKVIFMINHDAKFSREEQIL